MSKVKKAKDAPKRPKNDPMLYKEMYDSGETDLSKIAEKFGVGRQAVYVALKKSGVKLPDKRKGAMSDFNKKDIVTALNSSDSIQDAANKLGVSYPQLYSAIKTHRITAKRTWK